MIQSQQNYISNELTHFIGKDKASDDEKYKLLFKILQEGKLIHPLKDAIVATNASGTCLKVCPNAKLSENEMFNPEMVCFCDIPVGDLTIHIQKYGSFGLSFEKKFIVQHGGAPVYYIPKKAANNLTMFASSRNKGELFDKITPQLFDYLGFDIITSSPSEINSSDLIKKTSLTSFLGLHIFSYLKFFDHELKESDKENYYFEREWHIVGNIQFQIEDVQRIIMPKAYARKFRQDFPKYYGQLTFAD